MRLQFEERHAKWGLTAFFVITASIIVFFTIYRFEAVTRAFSIITTILMPFIYGLVFAYLLYPIYNIVTKATYCILDRKRSKRF